MRATFCILFVLACCSAAWAGSVRLANDTAFTLKSIIRAADGTQLGEVVVPPNRTMEWSDYLGGVGNIKYNDVSQTPYTVLWFCNEGGDPFSVCTGVSTGSTVTASSCDGTKSCKLPKKKTGGRTYPPELPEQKTQQQTQQDAGPPEGALEE